MALLSKKWTTKRSFVTMREDLDKPGKRAVIGLFHLWREDTARKLIRIQVISDTLTALAFSGAGLIGTGAFCFIDFNLAFHGKLPLQIDYFWGNSPSL